MTLSQITHSLITHPLTLAPTTFSTMPKQQLTTQTSRNLTMQQKSTLIQHHATNPSMKHAELAQWVQQQFNLPKTPDRIIIVKILKDKEKYHIIASQDQFLKHSYVLSHSELNDTLTN